MPSYIPRLGLEWNDDVKHVHIATNFLYSDSWDTGAQTSVYELNALLD